MWYRVQHTLAIDGLTYNFLPSWWTRNYDLSFGERMVFDPDYRVSAYQFMERTVHQRFPGLAIGADDPQPRVVAPDFGNAITPAVAGCEVVYPEDNYPWNKHLSCDRIHDLTLPHSWEQVFPFNEITSQVAYLNRSLGQDVAPWWNVRGVLNDAVLIGGTDVLADLADRSAPAQSLLAFCHGILLSVIRHNYHQFGYRGIVMLTNCTVSMVSPNTYDRQLARFDRTTYRLADGFGHEFGIHHCGRFERYAPGYRVIPRVDFLEIGWGSDIRLALDMFPKAVVQYILSAVFVASASPGELRDSIQALLDAARGNWHRFRLSMPDIEYGTPDDNLQEIYACCRDAQ